MKRSVLFCCTIVLAIVLAGCSSGTSVYVQSVDALMRMGGIAPGDRFSGMVVSKNVAEIQKDSDKTVKELMVHEGDDVREGQALFCYDTDELQLALDKQTLEAEQLHSTIDSLTRQIRILESEQQWAYGSLKLEYSIQIQTAQVDLKTAQINLKNKEAEVQKSQDLLDHSTVVSPVKGRVQAIRNAENDRDGNPLPYITIQQSGAYKIKGVLGELQRGAVSDGDRMTILSRTDPNVRWSGTVTLVDYENPSQNTGNSAYGPSGDEMSTSSRYPFYIELDSTDGLLLGQHVYLEREVEDGSIYGPSISSSFICYDADGTAYVWAAKGNKLEKRLVSLGTYNPDTDLQEILAGITPEDYIAYPDPDLCVPGAPVTRDAPAVEGGAS